MTMSLLSCVAKKTGRLGENSCPLLEDLVVCFIFTLLGLTDIQDGESLTFTSPSITLSFSGQFFRTDF